MEPFVWEKGIGRGNGNLGFKSSFFI